MNSPLGFQSPELLWALLALPLLVAGYLWLLRRRKRAALRYASLALVKEAVGAGGTWRRHLPPLLFLAALAALLLALARPQAVISLPSQQQTVILVMDVSGSMRADDVKPTRLEAAQVAARAFVADQPPHTRIGVVAFAGTAQLVQAPTRSREDVIAAIDRFQLQRGTATGSGLVLALAALFPQAGLTVEALQGGRAPGAGGPRTAPLGALGSRDGMPDRGAGPDPLAPAELVPPGSYKDAVIVLLSDGQRTTGPDPLVAAKLAADRGVRVYTVGVGTKAGATIGFEVHVKLDEETLQSIATMTQGEYFQAATAVDLKKVYETLNTRIVLETRQTEVTAVAVAAALLLLLLSAGLSVAWFHRVV